METEEIQVDTGASEIGLEKSLIPHVAVHDVYWAIEERSAQQLLAMLGATNAVAHRAEFEAKEQAVDPLSSRDFDLSQGVAIISIVGPMTKAPTSMEPGCSTVACRRRIRAAAADDQVKAIILRIDSPGGSVSGTDDLAQDVREARDKKPVYAYIEDDCCSAAYWVASQATKVYAAKTSRVGSLGVYTAIPDWSRMYENAGVKVHLLSTGKHKGAGATGTRIDDAHLAEWQSAVDEFNKHFLSAVAKGRRMALAKVQALADGRVWIGEKAVENGLVDEIATFDQVFTSLRGKKGAQAVSGEGESHADMPLAEQSEMALAAVHGLTTRLAGLRQVREDEGRSLSEKALGHAREMLEALDALRSEIVAVAEEPPSDRARLAREALTMALLDASV